MSSTITLKIKTKSGQFIVKKENSIQFSDLKRELAQLTQLNENQVQIRFGFPPRVIGAEAGQNEDECLNKLGIQNGDTLIVDKKKTTVGSLESPSSSEPPVGGNDGGGGVCGRRGVEEKRSVAPETKKKCETLIGPQNNHHVGGVELEEEKKTGVLLRQTVPSDNSCLFTSIGFTLNGKVDTSAGSFMRQMIAESISNDKETYCDAILGKPNDEYVKWIQKSDSWGGAIELSILSNLYGIEIAVIDTINQIINRFGEDQKYPHRVYLIFDGIHYDPLYWEPLTVNGKIQTIFATTNEEVYKDAEKLAMEANQSKQYTDVAKFTLKCLDCNKVLTGQREATQHAKSTGHTNFDECNS